MRQASRICRAPVSIGLGRRARAQGWQACRSAVWNPMRVRRARRGRPMSAVARIRAGYLISGTFQVRAPCTEQSSV